MEPMLLKKKCSYSCMLAPAPFNYRSAKGTRRHIGQLDAVCFSPLKGGWFQGLASSCAHHARPPPPCGRLYKNLTFFLVFSTLTTFVRLNFFQLIDMKGGFKVERPGQRYIMLTLIIIFIF